MSSEFGPPESFARTPGQQDYNQLAAKIAGIPGGLPQAINIMKIGEGDTPEQKMLRLLIGKAEDFKRAEAITHGKNVKAQKKYSPPYMENGQVFYDEYDFIPETGEKLNLVKRPYVATNYTFWCNARWTTCHNAQ